MSWSHMIWLDIIKELGHTDEGIYTRIGPYETVGSFSCIKLKISLGLHPGRLARR